MCDLKKYRIGTKFHAIQWNSLEMLENVWTNFIAIKYSFI